MAARPPRPNVDGMGARPDANVYEIRVRGELTPQWSGWFAGMTVSVDGGETVIRGPVDDQAALHGVLARVRDLGLTLLAVRVVAEGSAG